MSSGSLPTTGNNISLIVEEELINHANDPVFASSVTNKPINQTNCTMMNRIANTLLLALVAVLSADAFAPIAVNTRQIKTSLPMAVVDIDGESTFDKTIKSAGSSLVIIEYSTTWCGPCKVIARKFEEFSDQYPNAVFLKVR